MYTNGFSKAAILALGRSLGELNHGIAPGYVIAEANVSTHKYTDIGKLRIVITNARTNANVFR